MKTKISLLCLVCLVFSALLFLVSCSESDPDDGPDPTDLPDKTFTLNQLSLILTEGFSLEIEGGTAILRASTIVVFVDRLDFSSMAGAADLPLLTYAKDYSDKATESDGLVLLEYSTSGASGSQSYAYFTAFYKSAGAFYTLQFACRAELYTVYREVFVKWAKSAVPTA